MFSARLLTPGDKGSNKGNDKGNDNGIDKCIDEGIEKLSIDWLMSRNWTGEDSNSLAFLKARGESDTEFGLVGMLLTLTTSLEENKLSYVGQFDVVIACDWLVSMNWLGKNSCSPARSRARGESNMENGLVGTF